MKAGANNSIENVQNCANGTICQFISIVVSNHDLVFTVYCRPFCVLSVSKCMLLIVFLHIFSKDVCLPYVSEPFSRTEILRVSVCVYMYLYIFTRCFLDALLTLFSVTS